MKNYIMLVAACTTLGACSQTKSISTLEKKIPTTYAEKVDVVKEQVAIIPDWYFFSQNSVKTKLVNSSMKSHSI